MSTKKHYKNKLAFVIGGSEGIGKAVAKQLLTLGSNVVIFSRQHEKLVSAQTEIKAATLHLPIGFLRTMELDIRDFKLVCERFQSAILEFGTPDFVINCAGFARPGYISDLDIKHYQDMMELNYFGTVHVCKAILPYLLKRGSGHIVTTSSIAGFIGLFGYTGYCASKFAVLGFSEALKRELAPHGIRVTVLCPPNTRTPGLEAENQFKPQEVLATEEKVKVVDPEFVAIELLNGIAKSKFMIIPTFDGSLAHRLNRFVPSLLEQFVKRKPLT